MIDIRTAHMNWHSRLRKRRTTLISLDEHTPTNSHAVMVASRQLPTDSPYILPWNTEEVNRLDFQHYLLRQAMSGNYRAPIKRLKNILDVGCGTGRWAQEMAQAFSDANVIGLDIFDPPEATQIGADLQVAGLENVKAETFILPVGQWGGRQGSTTATNMRAACLAMKPLVLQHLGVNSGEYDRLLEYMFQECEQH